jgi:hypothetical protein
MEFANLGGGTVLVFPLRSKAPNRYTALIEGHPVQPDVPAPWVGPYALGQDALWEAGIAEAVRLVRAGGGVDSVRNR